MAEPRHAEGFQDIQEVDWFTFAFEAQCPTESQFRTNLLDKAKKTKDASFPFTKTAPYQTFEAFELREGPYQYADGMWFMFYRPSGQVNHIHVTIVLDQKKFEKDNARLATISDMLNDSLKTLKTCQCKKLRFRNGQGQYRSAPFTAFAIRNKRTTEIMKEDLVVKICFCGRVDGHFLGDHIKNTGQARHRLA